MKFYLSIFLAIVFFIYPDYARAEFSFPSCDKIESWANSIKTTSKQRVQPGTTNPNAKIQDLERDAIYADPITLQVFGRGFSEWNPEEVKSFKFKFSECQRLVVQRGDQQMQQKMAVVYSKIHKDERGMVGATNNDNISIKEASCAELRPWFDMYHNNVKSILNDTKTQSFFEVPYSKWNADDRRKAKEIVTLCARNIVGKQNMQAHHAARSVMFELNRVLQNSGEGPYKAAPKSKGGRG